MSEAVNNPYKQEAPDKTLSIEGVAADAKAVGNSIENIKTDVSSKINRAENIGYCHQTNTCDCDLSGLENGDYLLIATRSGLISSFAVQDSGVTAYGSNISVSGKTLTIKNLQWYTSVQAIKIK